MSFFGALFGSTSNYSEITPSQLHTLRPGTRLIDVRQPEEFDGDLSHLADAELVPLGTLPAVAKNWDKSAPYLLICRSGSRSGQACHILGQMGFSDVTNLRGGMMAVRTMR